VNVRIPVSNASLAEEDARAVADAVRSGRVSAGTRVQAFEQAFASYIGAGHAVAVNTGTAALHVALAALGVGPGDEVIVPSLTFISTANVALYLGATPVLCDCDPETYNVTAAILEKHITPRTKAMVPVEMNGLPLDYDAIVGLSTRTGVPLVIDSAESLGSAYMGRLVGSQALVHAFSFYPNKTITTGEGGMLTTGDARLASTMRTLVNQGQDGRYNHVALGYNYRMTEMQGALGSSQLRRIGLALAEKERIASAYDRDFTEAPGVDVPPRPPYATAQSWFMYSVRLRDVRVRDATAMELAKRGIETRLGFPPVHTQPYYRKRYGYRPGDFPDCLAAWRRKLDIPAWPGLPEPERQEIVSVIAQMAGDRAASTA
jgi:perosamine synthetase